MPSLTHSKITTSASQAIVIDVNSEKIITEEIEKIKKYKTIIVISHNINALKSCDRILKIINKMKGNFVSTAKSILIEDGAKLIIVVGVMKLNDTYKCGILECYREIPFR